MRPPRLVYFFGFFEELDDLLQLLLGLVHSGHVGEADLHFVVGIGFGLAAAEGHHSAFGATHPAEEEAPDGDDEDQREQHAEQIREPAVDQFAACT